MKASRLVGWPVSLATGLLSLYPPGPLAAQIDATIGAQLVLADYREVSSDLRFRGGGVGVSGSLSWKRLGVDVAFASYQYDPADGSTAAAPFDARQFDLRLRYYLAGPASVEIGVVNREAEPEFEAQSVGAVRLGAHLASVLGPGVRMTLRSAMLVGAKFSGGGTTGGLGSLEVGLGIAVDALKGRLRFTGDYEFQRIARQTASPSGDIPVPLQQALGRVGLAVAF